MSKGKTDPNQETIEFHLVNGAHSCLEDGVRIVKKPGDILRLTQKQADSFPGKFTPVVVAPEVTPEPSAEEAASTKVQGIIAGAHNEAAEIVEAAVAEAAEIIEISRTEAAKIVAAASNSDESSEASTPMGAPVTGAAPSVSTTKPATVVKK